MRSDYNIILHLCSYFMLSFNQINLPLLLFDCKKLAPMIFLLQYQPIVLLLFGFDFSHKLFLYSTELFFFLPYNLNSLLLQNVGYSLIPLILFLNNQTIDLNLTETASFKHNFLLFLINLSDKPIIPLSLFLNQNGLYLRCPLFILFLNNIWHAILEFRLHENYPLLPFIINTFSLLLHIYGDLLDWFWNNGYIFNNLIVLYSPLLLSLRKDNVFEEFFALLIVFIQKSIEILLLSFQCFLDFLLYDSFHFSFQGIDFLLFSFSDGYVFIQLLLQSN